MTFFPIARLKSGQDIIANLKRGFQLIAKQGFNYFRHCGQLGNRAIVNYLDLLSAMAKPKQVSNILESYMHSILKYVLPTTICTQ